MELTVAYRHIHWGTVHSYTALVVAVIVVSAYPEPALFVIGAVTISLVFIGNHNAWDIVTYIAIEVARPEKRDLD